jgi:flagella basal body P-ring formation protein FlgA
MDNSIFRFLGLTILSLVVCHPAAIGEQIGYDSVTGQKRVVKKTDKTLVGTKQFIDEGQVVQRNALRYTILPKDAQVSQSQYSTFEQCIGKVAKIGLSCSTCLGSRDLKPSSRYVSSSRVVKAIVPIEPGDFVDPKWVTVIEKPIPPNKTPMEWISNLKDAVGRKAIRRINSGDLITENDFGPRGTLLHPEETKVFPGFN